MVVWGLLGDSKLSNTGLITHMRRALMDNIGMRIRLKIANSQSRRNEKFCFSLHQLHKVYMKSNVQDLSFGSSSPSEHYHEKSSSPSS